MRIKNTNSRFKFGKSILWILTVPFIVAAILMTVEMASSGASLSKLEREEAVLRAENQNLNDELVQASSLSSFESSSESLGLTKAEKIIYITEKDAVAKLP